MTLKGINTTMNKLILSIPLILSCFNALSNENPEIRTDRLAKAAQVIFARVITHFDPALIAFAGLTKCNEQSDVATRLKAFITREGAEYSAVINTKIIEMSKSKSSICLNQTTCNDDLYLVLNMVNLMQGSYVASSISTMRLVDVNAKYCKQVQNVAVHILDQKSQQRN